jgi:hypothetical protein
MSTVYKPGPHPGPPDLSGRRLPLRTVHQPWMRSHRAEHHPVWFGRTGDNRFDAPDGSFGVLYLAGDAHCAFIETFGHGHAGGHRFVTADALRARALSTVAFPAPLRLVDLTDTGLARIGADMRLCAGDYEVSQAWSAALWGHGDRPDGLYYRARHDASRFCAAVFDRCEPGIAATRLGSLAERRHRALLAELLDAYDFGLLD